ncbi:unnamed protein product [Gongylonema pulchrum]|uniref:Uncharacterized protein n=1 Tax=Gongylonema pulchrum TaxID=637853 RepID=A0A183EDQ0_9BILA|nr:unnamed protein product [Gongylonema pulchrum]
MKNAKRAKCFSRVGVGLRAGQPVAANLCCCGAISFSERFRGSGVCTLATSKINSRLDRLLPEYLRETVEWITR